MIDPTKLIATVGVYSKHPDFVQLQIEVIKNFNQQPEVCTDGGDDQSFFVFNFNEIKMYAVANEVGGLTIMLPEEY